MAYVVPTILNLESFRKQLNAILALITAKFALIDPGAGSFVGTVSTTDATVTTAATVATTSSATFLIDTRIIARRTGGASGATGDGAGYELTGVAKNIAGTVTIIGQTVTFTGESQAGWDVALAVSGANILVRVTGAAANNVNWSVSGRTLVVV